MKNKPLINLQYEETTGDIYVDMPDKRHHIFNITFIKIKIADAIKLIKKFNSLINKDVEHAEILSETEKYIKEQEMCTNSEAKYICGVLQKGVCENYDISGIFPMDNVSYNQIQELVSGDEEKLGAFTLQLNKKIIFHENKVEKAKQILLEEEQKLAVYNKGMMAIKNYMMNKYFV